MAPETSFVVITWTLLGLLAFGLAGCLRAIKTLSLKIDDRFQSPRRLQVGDTLALPDELATGAHGERYIALLFVSASCAVCRLAIDTLRPDVDRLRDVAMRILWAEDVPDEYHGVGFAHQSEVFAALNVPVTPLLIVIDVPSSAIVARGLIGSDEELARARDQLHRLRGRDTERSQDAEIGRAVR